MSQVNLTRDLKELVRALNGEEPSWWSRVFNRGSNAPDEGGARADRNKSIIKKVNNPGAQAPLLLQEERN